VLSSTQVLDHHSADPRPLVVGFGGTTRSGSSSELALRASVRAAEAAGADVVVIPAAELEFPMYRASGPSATTSHQFVDAIRRADGLIIASPGYHGGMSGLVKNAIDYLEELRDDERPYLDGRAVGCIACASGWQATSMTLTSMRSTVHALRGWPTPLDD
jgi:FMN reductase